MKKTAPSISRLTILNEIMACFYQVIQWDEFCYDTKDNVVEYQHKADTLIELLEVEDCGSCGGFDKNNPLKRETNYKSFDRFLCVLRKYNKPSDLDENHIDEYIKYFNKKS